MKVTYTSILDAIYASSALATLTPEHRVTLLHPDYAPALKALIPDAFSIILARCADLSFSVNFTDDLCEIEAPDLEKSVLFEHNLRSAVVAVIYYIIRLAAGQDSKFPSAELENLNNCAGLLFCSHLNKPVRIRRCYY